MKIKIIFDIAILVHIYNFYSILLFQNLLLVFNNILLLLSSIWSSGTFLQTYFFLLYSIHFSSLKSYHFIYSYNYYMFLVIFFYNISPFLINCKFLPYAKLGSLLYLLYNITTFFNLLYYICLLRILLSFTFTLVLIEF